MSFQNIFRTQRTFLSGILSLVLVFSAFLTTNIKGQTTTTCNYNSPSLNPTAAFQSSVNNYIQNILNLPLTVQVSGFNKTITSTSLTVNSADLLQNFQASFPSVYGRGKVIFYNLNSGANFPPTGTATLPRVAFNPIGVLAYYIHAGQLTGFQLQAVQNLYAVDLTSRRNYAVNLANLARNLTNLRNAGGNATVIDTAMDVLRNAYNTLSDTQAVAPSPRFVYRQIAIAYILLLTNHSSSNFSTIPQSTLESYLTSSSDAAINLSYGNNTLTGMNILAIGGSNYDTNRLPVVNGNNTPTPASCTGCFPLTNFETARNTPLSTAQANPAAVFGANVLSFAKRFGLLNRTATASFNYQVNSADQLQYVIAPINSSLDYLCFFFAKGFPVTSGTQLPEFAFSTSVAAGQYLFDPRFGGTYSSATQAALTTYYANPANATRRTNYGKNLQNLICAFQKIQQEGGLTTEQSTMVRNSLSALSAAQTKLNRGELPDIFLTYQTIINNTPNFFPAFGIGTATQASLSETIKSSLIPIGLINYYYVPIVLGNIGL